ncbi:MAG: EthD domain-containing protein, partial [Thermoanaerobaculia bacterium]|nr:EthD domain-containing protein [Thermoanaerobaculia bacterium]
MERDGEPDAYKLLLCHRRRRIVPTAEFHGTWREKARELTLDHQPTLGFSRYAQVHQVAWADPLYEGIVTSRSRPVTNLVSRLVGRRPDPAEQDSLKWRRERWDVVEEMWFDDREGMLNAWQSAEGRKAAEELVALRT